MEAIKRTQETDTVKPGQVATNLDEEELDHREGSESFETEPMKQNAQEPNNKPNSPSNGHNGNFEPKGKGRRSSRRGRYDYSKNGSSSHSDQESSIVL
jgi:hypothetical protein